MKTPLLLSAGVVLGIAIGLAVAKAGNGAGNGKPAATRAGSGAGLQHAPSRTETGAQRVDSFGEGALAALLKGRAIGELTADEAYELIEPCLMTSTQADPLERTRLDYQLRLLTSKLPPAVLEEVLEMGRAGDVSIHRLHPLFGAYAVRDWDRAMAWAEKQPDADRLKSVAINSLTHVDPDRAGELYQKELRAGRTRGISMEIRNNLAAAHARQGTEAFFRFADSMPLDQTLGLTGLAVRSVSPDEFPRFMEEVKRRVAAGSLPAWEIDNLVASMASTRPDLARQWMAELVPEDKRADYEFNLAVNMSSSLMPEESEDLMRTAMARKPGEEKTLITNRLYSVFTNDPEMAVKLATLLPEDQKLTPEDVRKAIPADYHNPDKAVAVARLMHSPDEQCDYLVENFGMLGNPRYVPALGRRANPSEKEFELMERRLELLGLTGEAGEKTKAALEEAKARVRATR